MVSRESKKRATVHLVLFQEGPEQRERSGRVEYVELGKEAADPLAPFRQRCAWDRQPHPPMPVSEMLLCLHREEGPLILPRVSGVTHGGPNLARMIAQNCPVALDCVQAHGMLCK